MPYNLIYEPWIPVRYEGGETGWIEPWRVTDPDRPPVALAAPRPDFNGALIQFLIGLVQTCCPPETERAWRRWFKEPPTPDELKAAFTRYEHAFNLDGDGPRFMQDYHFVAGHETDRPKDERLDIAELVIDSGSASNTYFNKGRSEWCLGSQATATALFAMQTHAPSGGRGHRASLRGESPVTTVIDTVGKCGIAPCW